MKFLELVKLRRSCRRYASKEVSREIIERCLEAARWAPSACNSQPWHFIVIDDPALKNKLADKAFSTIHSFNSFVKKAPVFVVVIRERSTYAAKLGGSLRGVQYSLIDLGIAVEHFVLQAAEEGLGTCWIGWFNERAVKKVLDIPSRKKVDVILSLGYPEKTEHHSKERKPLSEMSEFR